MELRDIVQAAIDAYHDHDLDRCLSYYAPDVVVKDANGTIPMDGTEAVRARYARSMIDNPNIRICSAGLPTFGPPWRTNQSRLPLVYSCNS